jgi:nicotinamidase-related amidase
MSKLFNEMLIPARPHPFPLDLSSTALLVIDVQNDFCHPEGYCQGDLQLDGCAARKIIEPIQKLVQWAREETVPVIWTVEAHKPDLSDLTPSKEWRYEKAGYPVGSVGQRGKYLVQGEWGAQVVPELAPQDDELILPKPAQSVFVNTNLENKLRTRGITHLLMCGVTTQCCVLASYRHANDLGFFSLLVEDCCAAFDHAEHEAALAVITSEGGAVGWATSSESLFAATGTKLES